MNKILKTSNVVAFIENNEFGMGVGYPQASVRQTQEVALWIIFDILLSGEEILL